MHLLPSIVRAEGTEASLPPEGVLAPANRRVLNSWKEISRYVNRGVRTLQRWERELGFPVRRPRGKSRSAVIAFTDEIDDWLRSAARRAPERQSSRPAIQELHVRNLELALATRKLVERAHNVYVNVESALERYRIRSAARQRRLPERLS